MLRRTPLKRGKPLRKASKNTRKALKVYSAKRKLFLTEHPYCAAGPVLIAQAYIDGLSCTEVATDVHHKAGRGTWLNIEATWIPVCRQCHQWIHDHASTARTLALLK